MKRWKAVCGVVLIFLSGALAGAVVTHRVDETGVEAFWSARRGATGDLIARRLSRSLDLDRAQREQVRAIVAETRREIVEIRKPVQPAIDAALSRARARVREILRPDQQERFDRLNAARRARHRE
jgi:Spy/CpxP family protein refolding chaperone